MLTPSQVHGLSFCRFGRSRVSRKEFFLRPEAERNYIPLPPHETDKFHVGGWDSNCLVPNSAFPKQKNMCQHCHLFMCSPNGQSTWSAAFMELAKFGCSNRGPSRFKVVCITACHIREDWRMFKMSSVSAFVSPQIEALSH